MSRAFPKWSFLILALFPFAVLAQNTVTLGTGGGQNSSTSYPAPYGNFYHGAKHQMLIRASELNSAGMCSGDITSLSFNVADSNGVPLQDFTIKIKATSSSSVGSNFQSGFTTVYGPVTITDSMGWNEHVFSTPFNWNGTSNLLIETCFNNSSWTSNAEMYQTNVGFQATNFYRNDVPDVCTNPGTPTTTSARPDMRLEYAANSPTANFSSNTTYTCSGNIDFYNLSACYDSAYWEFGDGDTSTQTNPSHTYSSDGTYTVTLIVTGSAGGADTLEKTNFITVNTSQPSPQPASCTPTTQNSSPGFGIHNVTFNTINNNSDDAATEGYADFTCLNTDVLEGQVYSLSLETDTPTTHNVKAWIDFNDDGVLDNTNEVVLDQESVLNPSTSVKIPSTAVLNTPLRMRVMADYDVGTPPLTPCTDPQYGQAEDYTVTINSNPNPPIADFTVSDTLTCDGSVQFTDQSLNAPTGWHWDFGDGNTSTAQNPSHTYSSSGYYTVELIVYKNSNSDTATYVDLVHVDLGSAVTPASCTPTTLAYCCDYGIYEVNLNNIQHNSQDASEGYMDFTCGHHTEVTEGNQYTMSIKTGQNNAQDTKAWLDLNNNGSFESSELVFEELNKINPSATITIPTGGVINTPLRLRVISDVVGSSLGPCSDPEKGQAEDYSVTILPSNDPPIADFTADRTYSCEGTIQFTDQSTQGPTSWLWDFGDGNTSTQQNPSHTYATSGSYSVKLKVTNPYGTDSLTKTNYITIDYNGFCDTVNLPVTGGGQTQTACNGVLTDDGGADQNYSNNSNGYITIDPSSSGGLELIFEEFDYEDGWDSLRIYEGTSTSGPVVGTYTGSNLPGGGSVIVSSGAATIQQFTDGVINRPGFIMKWGCNVGFDEDDKPEEKPLSVFPNPTQGSFQIDLDQGWEDNSTIRILDATGRLIMENNMDGGSQRKFELSGRDPGVYFIEVFDSKDRTWERIVVE